METIEYHVMMDGHAWVCHGPDFINLQESTAAYGETEEEAVLEYCKLFLMLKHS